MVILLMHISVLPQSILPPRLRAHWWRGHRRRDTAGGTADPVSAQHRASTEGARDADRLEEGRGHAPGDLHRLQEGRHPDVRAGAHLEAPRQAAGQLQVRTRALSFTTCYCTLYPYPVVIFLSRLNMVAVWNNDGKFEMLREVSDLLANDESGDEDEDGGDDSS